MQILAAARGLREVSVEQAADAAGVSRATAYRYFPTQESLEVELDSDRVWAETQARIQSGPVTAATVIDAVVSTVTKEERHVRKGLVTYNDTWLREPDGGPVRRGRRTAWIDRIIDGLPSVAEDKRSKLRVALALVIGPDPVLMLKDVAGVEGDETKEILEWAAAALIAAATD